MSVRVDVAPALLAWAIERSGRPADELSRRFPHLEEWRVGSASPTLKQLENFAAATYTPDTEGVRRGFTKYVGLPMVSLGLALAAAVCNVRHQRNFGATPPTAPTTRSSLTTPPSTGGPP